MLPGDLRTHGFLESYAWRIHALHMGKTCLQEVFAIANPTCYQTNGNTAGMSEDSHRQLPHQRLSVGRAFACDNEVGILDDFAEVDDIEQQINTWSAFGVEVLQEGIA